MEKKISKIDYTQKPDLNDIREFLSDLKKYGWNWWQTVEEMSWRGQCIQELSRCFDDYIERIREEESE